MDKVGEKTGQPAGGSTLYKIEVMGEYNSVKSKGETDAHRWPSEIVGFLALKVEVHWHLTRHFSARGSYHHRHFEKERLGLEVAQESIVALLFGEQEGYACWQSHECW